MQIQKYLELTATVARDRAIETVSENAGHEWKRQAMEVFRNMQEQEMTGEDIRLAAEEKNIVPHHPNAWGGFIMGLVRQGYLIHTGKYRAPKARKSHGRESKVYIKGNN
jgi:hypothetical protein